MRRESTIIRDILCIIALVMCVACGHAPANAYPVVPGIYGGAVTPPPSTTCPNGLTWAAYDGCQGASLTSLYMDATIPANYILDASGNPGTLNHFPTDYNRAGIDFAVGPSSPYVYTDPQDMAFSCSSCSTNGTTTLTITTIAGGGHCVAGEVLWQTGFITDHPIIQSCASSTAPTTATLDHTEASHSGQMYASTIPGCYWTTAPGVGFPPNNPGWVCSFVAPNATQGVFDHVEFGAVGGHAATVLHFVGNSNHIGPKIINSHISPDSFLNATSPVQAQINSVTDSLSDVDFEFNDCDGGNTNVPPGSPNSSYSNTQFGLECFSWNALGTSGGIANARTVTFKYNYVHGWASNPVGLGLSYGNDIIQANVFRNNGGANGDAPTGNGGHGSSIQMGTTHTGTENYAMHYYGNTILYPAGYRQGVTTAPQAFLAGVSSALTFDDLDIEATNIYGSTTTTAGKAVASVTIDPFRVGEIVSYKAHHNYWNNLVSSQCFGAGPDYATSSGGSSVTISANAGLGTSIMTISGLTGSPGTIPYQYQILAHTSTGFASAAITFTATQTDNGDGTSTLNITAGAPATMAVGSQVFAPDDADPVANPTLIVSGSGSTYVISNGSGSGETHGSQKYWANVHAIRAFGSTDPNTGLPTTASGGTTVANYNGTYLVTGEETDSVDSSKWVALFLKIDNWQNFATDFSDNYDIQTAGSAGQITVDGWGMAGPQQCPNTQPS